MSAGRHGLPRLVHVFGDESGSFDKGDWQVIGLLFVADPAQCRIELAAMRANYDVPPGRELKYSDTDVVTLPYGLAVIDWFLKRPGVSFAFIAKSGNEHDLSKYRTAGFGLRPEQLAYNYTYKQVLKNNLPGDDRVLVTVDQQTRTKNDNLLTYLKRDLPTVRDVVDGDSKSDDLLQVADLLTGCMYGNLTQTKQGRKRSLSDTLVRGGGMVSARTRYPKVGRDKVNAWVWHPKKNEPPTP
jgi:hypothetical protein